MTARADQRAGRRRAAPEPRQRWSRSPRPAPSRPATLGPSELTGTRPAGRDRETPEPLPPPKPVQVRRWPARLVRASWLVLTLAATAALVLAWTPIDVPAWVPRAGAAAVTVTFAFGLAARAGGRAVVAGALALVLALVALLTSLPVLLAAAAVTTATVGAVLGVMVTGPAARFRTVARECLLAVLVAVVAAFAVNAYDAQVSLERASYLVLGLALLGALALAYRLAAGLHGLGRRGAVMLVSGLGLLAVTLAYSEALGRWGSPEVVHAIEGVTRRLRDLLGAVPRPTELLLGIPALAWGVSTRARRRQGWWGTGFGAAGLAVVATSLLDREVSLLEAGLATGYSLAAGLVLGYLVIRADSFASGARGRRARRLEEASAHRPEPGRTQPLL
jgi:hypothetical protein